MKPLSEVPPPYGPREAPNLEAPAVIEVLFEAPNAMPLVGQHLIEFTKTSCPGMPRLERMQRIAGSLGKHADKVWFGCHPTLSGLTMQDIGDVIGTLPPLHPH